MDVQNNNTEQNNSFFSKYFKNIILIFLFTVVIIFLCIVFIKFGSNNFLWETQKNKKEPDGIRTKRGIEDRIKELKEQEKITLSLDLLEKMDNMEYLESRLAQAETELNALKEKYEKNNILMGEFETQPGPLLNNSNNLSKSENEKKNNKETGSTNKLINTSEKKTDPKQNEKLNIVDNINNKEKSDLNRTNDDSTLSLSFIPDVEPDLNIVKEKDVNKVSQNENKQKKTKEEVDVHSSFEIEDISD